jgi:polyhydroxybutyrate depolymerase
MADTFLRRWGWALAVLSLTLTVGCGDDPLEAAPPTGESAAATEVDGRPYVLSVPASYRADQPAPLVILLHGYTSSAAQQELYFKLGAESERRGFLYALPDGTQEADGDRFWNATDACCNFQGSTVDDSAYLSRLIDQVKASHSVDARRVYLVGHSNGGYMAYRMACDHADQITAVVSLAGATWRDPARCTPARPVSVLQIHGTADDVVSYAGGGRYPGAEETVGAWRAWDSCAPEGTSAAPLDLAADVEGAETTVTAYTGCGGGTVVELWAMQGGSHVPALTDAFAPAVVDFLYARVSS